MKVGELTENLAKRQESRRMIRLGDITVADDCSTVSTPADDKVPAGMYMLDDQTLAVFARYLKVPLAYLKECPPDFRADTLKFWRDQKGQADVMVETVADSITGLYSPGLMMLPVSRIGAMVERVFKPEDEIRHLVREEKKFHLDVTSNDYQVDVPNPNRIPGRPEVGDITCGGVRFLAHPDRVKAPSVSRFLHRLVCTNGMTTSESEGRIVIKGLTVPEVIASMEEAAELLLSDMDVALDRYQKTADIPVPGHPLSFAEQLGHEFSVPQRVLHTVLDRVRQLPEEGTTVYDVNQAFTSVANEVRSYDTRSRLQTIGGSLAIDAARMIERCTQCERLLVE